VITCTSFSRGAHLGAELGEILVGSLRGVAICGVVRACTLQGRELCLERCVMGPLTALAGVCLQDVERGAHEGGKRLLDSRLRPVSSKATHPPTYPPLHTIRHQASLQSAVVGLQSFSAETPKKCRTCCRCHEWAQSFQVYRPSGSLDSFLPCANHNFCTTGMCRRSKSRL